MYIRPEGGGKMDDVVLTAEGDIKPFLRESDGGEICWTLTNHSLGLNILFIRLSLHFLRLFRKETRLIIRRL